MFEQPTKFLLVKIELLNQILWHYVTSNNNMHELG